jgi:hypothetical protein
VRDAAKTAEGLGHRLDHVPGGGEPRLALGHHHSAIHFDVEAPGVAPNEGYFYAEGVSQCVGGPGGVRKVVAGDAIDDGDHGVRV